MPCNCRRCDCSNRASCLLIEGRLKTLACIFDKVADGTISVDQRSILNFGDSTHTIPSLSTPICTNNIFQTGNVTQDQKNYTYENSYILYCGTNPTNYVPSTSAITPGTVSLFSNDQNLTPADFIPQNSVSHGQSFLSAVLCLPAVNPKNVYCLTCLPVPICVRAICTIEGCNVSPSVSSSAALNNLENYGAIAQNLRYAASIIGCQYE
jgi:hypothetical protein